MDKLSYFLSFLIMIVGALIFTSYIDWPMSLIACGCWGLIVSIGARKIDEYVSINTRSSTE